eukprot:5000729-Amphidinium_carterae.1
MGPQRCLGVLGHLQRADKPSLTVVTFDSKARGMSWVLGFPLSVPQLTTRQKARNNCKPQATVLVGLACSKHKKCSSVCEELRERQSHHP